MSTSAAALSAHLKRTLSLALSKHPPTDELVAYLEALCADIVDVDDRVIVLESISGGAFTTPYQYYIDDSLMVDDPGARHFSTIAAALTAADINSPGLPVLCTLRQSSTGNGHLWDGNLQGVPYLSIQREGGPAWNTFEYQPDPDLNLTGATITHATLAHVSFHGLWIRGAWTVSTAAGATVSAVCHNCYWEDSITVDSGNSGGLVGLYAWNCSTVAPNGVVDNDWQIQVADGGAGGNVELFLQDCTVSSGVTDGVVSFAASTSASCVLDIRGGVWRWQQNVPAEQSMFVLDKATEVYMNDVNLQIVKNNARTNLFEVSANENITEMNGVDIHLIERDFTAVANGAFFMFSSGSPNIQGNVFRGPTVSIYCDQKMPLVLPPDAFDATQAFYDLTDTYPQLTFRRDSDTSGQWEGPNRGRALVATTTTGVAAADATDPNNNSVDHAILPGTTDRLYRVSCKALARDITTLGQGADLQVDGVVQVTAAGAPTIVAQATTGGGSGLNTGAVFTASLQVTGAPPRVQLNVDQGAHGNDCEWVATMELSESAA